MLASVAVRAAELLAVVLAAGTVTLAAGLWWVRRRVRRLRLTGRVMAARLAVAAGGAASRTRRRAWSMPLPDRRWLAVAVERRRLWRAVTGAEHAVAVARQADAPTGDLDGLCRRLRQAAGHADRRLSVSRRPSEPGTDVMAEISDVVAAAGLIQDAAASAVASVARPASASLAEDARREAVALAAGIAAAAGAGHRGVPG